MFTQSKGRSVKRQDYAESKLHTVTGALVGIVEGSLWVATTSPNWASESCRMASTTQMQSHELKKKK